MRPPEQSLRSAQYSFERQRLSLVFSNGIGMEFPIGTVSRLRDLPSEALQSIIIVNKGKQLSFDRAQIVIELQDLFHLINGEREGMLYEHESQESPIVNKEKEMTDTSEVEFFREFSGSAHAPDRQVDGSHVFIFNPCSVKSAWDEVFGAALSELDPTPEQNFDLWKINGSYEDRKDNAVVDFALGNIQLNPVKGIKGAIVVNALVKETDKVSGQDVVKYWALSQTLNSLYDRLLLAKEAGRLVEIHFECTEDFDGADWHVIKVLIEELAVENGIFTTVNYAS